MAFGALTSGISALRSFARGMEVIGNNIANVNTVSFKSSRTKYSETFNQILTQSSPSPQDGQGSNVTASQVGLGVQVDTIQGLFHQGGPQDLYHFTRTGRSSNITCCTARPSCKRTSQHQLVRSRTAGEEATFDNKQW